MNGELRFLLMNADYTEPLGFVLVEDRPRVRYDREENQYHGFTVTGEPLFSRKGMESANRASLNKDLRMCTVGWFGIPTRGNLTAPETVRLRESERRERAS